MLMRLRRKGWKYLLGTKSKSPCKVQGTDSSNVLRKCAISSPAFPRGMVTPLREYSASNRLRASNASGGLAGWYAAWNEPVDETRLETLRDCCADDIEFRDDWAIARGIDLLSLHISNCLKFVPGWKLAPTGDIRICRGEALVGWRSVGPDGSAQGGFNHIHATHDGTLQRVAGFLEANDRELQHLSSTEERESDVTAS